MMSDRFIDWVWRPWDATKTSRLVRVALPLWFIPWCIVWVVGGVLLLLIDVLYCIARWMIGSDV